MEYLGEIDKDTVKIIHISMYTKSDDTEDKYNNTDDSININLIDHILQLVFITIETSSQESASDPAIFVDIENSISDTETSLIG